MAGKNGDSDRPLSSLLFDEAHRFQFFQAVRLLERIYRQRRPVGGSSSPADEAVRFRTRASLDFPASELFEVTREDANGSPSPPQMIVNFMGLTGPQGVLPVPYTELLMERVRYKDTALRDFFDLFNHRIISLFYRAWEKFRFPVAYERGGENPFTSYLYDFIGMGTGGLKTRLGLRDEGLLLYAGLIAQRPHSATAIELMLGDYFGVRVTLEQFSGQWLDIDEESLTRVGTANSELGVNAIVGSRFWDRQSRFRVRIGPVDFGEFRSFLPKGQAFKPLVNLVRWLVGVEFDFDVQLILKAAVVPPCQLTTQGEEIPMLGWTSWLKTRPLKMDDPQLVLAAS
jgi:type VI secretion system protein ImpH